MIPKPGPGRSWRPLRDRAAAGAFLKTREPYCVAAAARFLSACGHAWALHDGEGRIAAMLIHSRQTLFPVFGGRAGIPASGIPAPVFLERFLKKNGIHAIQGLCGDAEALETLLASFGALPAARIDYDLMALDGPPDPAALLAGPAGLILRRPVPGDEEPLFRLQAAYEREEVIPPGAAFSPAACRLSLEHILSHERVLIAELDGRILGKINTNAASFSRRQIGGVYVLPEYRGRGAATLLTAAFAQSIAAEGAGVSLFVKKRNLPARSVYLRTGFAAIGDYRISYY